MSGVLEQLRLEFNQRLTFHYKGLRNVSRPEATTYRVKDQIAFQVFAKNTSTSVTMKSISGWISNAPATRFATVPFSVARLEPNDEQPLGAEITADVVADTNDVAMLRDKIASIHAKGFVDLSMVAFEDAQVLIGRILPE
jgi:hypothetical protein